MSTKIVKSVTGADAQHDRLKSSRENVRSNSVSEGISGLVQQAFTTSGDFQPEAVLTLLRKAGNQAVTRLLARRHHAARQRTERAIHARRPPTPYSLSAEQENVPPGHIEALRCVADRETALGTGRQALHEQNSAASPH